MTIQTTSLNQLTQQAIRILTKEVGVTDTLRFISQFSTGYGNYTEEREELFRDVSLEQIIAQIKNTQQIIAPDRMLD